MIVPKPSHLNSNRAVIPTQIVNRKRHHAVNLYALPLDRFAVPGDKRAPLQPAKIRHPVVADEDVKKATGVRGCVNTVGQAGYCYTLVNPVSTAISPTIYIATSGNR